MQRFKDGSRLLFGYRNATTREMHILNPHESIDFESSMFMACHETKHSSPLLAWRVPQLHAKGMEPASFGRWISSPSYVCVDLMLSIATSDTSREAEVGAAESAKCNVEHVP